MHCLPAEHVLDAILDRHFISVQPQLDHCTANHVRHLVCYRWYVRIRLHSQAYTENGAKGWIEAGTMTTACLMFGVGSDLQQRTLPSCSPPDLSLSGRVPRAGEKAIGLAGMQSHAQYFIPDH